MTAAATRQLVGGLRLFEEITTPRDRRPHHTEEVVTMRHTAPVLQGGTP